jgi:predicted RND superfamily exporter protein
VIAKIMEKFIHLNLKVWPLALFLTFGVIVFGIWSGRSIGLDSDLEALLPKSAESVVQMNLIKPKAGGSYDFKVVLEGGPLEKRLDAAEAFSNYLGTMPDFIRSARYKTPKTFLEKHKYQLVPMTSLEALHRRVERERKKNKEVTDPFGLEEAIDKKEAKVDASEEAENDQVDEAKDLLQRLDEMRPYYQTEEGDYLVIRVIPEVETLNIQKNRRILRKFKKVTSEFDFSKYGSEIKYSIYGKIPDHIEKYESILNDLSFGGWGIAIILMVVALFFRSFWANIILVPPLLAGLSLGLGILGFTEKSLNSIAVFLFLVVFGVGIEFGIHIWARMVLERKKKDLEKSLIHTWQTTGRATITSAVALLAGFALLIFSSFQGFAQFGRVAVVLITATAGCFLIFMPSWIIFVETIRKHKRWPDTLSNILVELPLKKGTGKLKKTLRAFSLVVGAVSLIVCALYLHFDYKFEESVEKTSKAESYQALYRVFTERLKPSAMAVFEKEEEASEFLNFYRENKKNYPDIALMTGLQTFLPIDLQERIYKLQDIGDDIEYSWIKKIEDEDVRKALKEIKDTSYDMKTYSRKDLPPETWEPFVASDKSGDFLVYLFDIGGDTDGRKAMKFSDAVTQFKKDSKLSPTLSGQEIVFADIVRRVIGEGPWLVMGMFLLVFLICWLDFRNLKDALFTVAPVLAGFAITGAVLVFSGTQINFFNMVALASLGAMVVDNSIHMYHRYLELRRSKEDQPDRQAAFTVSPIVVTCTMTSICGYGGMLFANHTGIASLGFVAVMGLISCLLSAVGFFPFWLEKSK